MPGALYAATAHVKDFTDSALKLLGVTRTRLEDYLSKANPKSLNQQVAGSISQFPVVITSDIPVDAAATITQMLEIEYANYLTLVLANSPRVNINEINDSKYLRKYHTNLNKLESVLNECFDMEDPAELAIARVIAENAVMDIRIDRPVMKQLMTEMIAAQNPPEKIQGLDWLMTEGKSGKDRGKDQRNNGRGQKRNYEPFGEDDDYDDDSSSRSSSKSSGGGSKGDPYAANKETRAAEKHRWDEEKHDWAWEEEQRRRRKEGRDVAEQDYKHHRDQQKDEIEAQKYSDSRQDREDDLKRQEDWRREDKEERKSDRTFSRGMTAANFIRGTAKDLSSEIRSWKQYNDNKKEQARRAAREEEQTVDSHVTRDFSKTFSYKKINEMQPTPVVARVFTKDDNGAPSRQIEVVSGVKAHLHPINKSELIGLVDKGEKGNALAQLVRFATGELNFFTDVLVSTSTIKEYAEKSSKFHSNGAKVMAILKRVKESNRTGKNAKPNATIVISKAASDEIKRKTGINLLDEDEAMDFCDKLNLIQFIVCDSMGGKLHVLQPGLNDTFTVMSTSTLEKQIDAVQDAALTKELRKIISKGD